MLKKCKKLKKVMRLIKIFGGIKTKIGWVNGLVEKNIEKRWNFVVLTGGNKNNLGFKYNRCCYGVKIFATGKFLRS